MDENEVVRALAAQAAASLDLDPIGPLLRDLDRVVTDLQQVVPARLLPDRVMVDGACVALMLVRERINQVAADRLQAAE